MEPGTVAQAAQLHGFLIKTGNAGGSSYELGKTLAFLALSPSGDLRYARSIFDSLRRPSSFCTNIILRAYAKHSSRPNEALILFSSRRRSCLPPYPDKFTYPFLFCACRRLRTRNHGRELHGLALRGGLTSDYFIQCSLVHMYATCDDLDSALRVLDRMTQRSVVAWTTAIDGARESGRALEALGLFSRMEADGVEPNDATLVSVLGACADVGSLSVGRKVHEIARRMGLHLNTQVSTALVDMYSKCGHINIALEVFDKMLQRDAFAFTVMIAGLGSHGRCQEALDLFRHMTDVEELEPNDRTITAVLSACRNAGWIDDACKLFNHWKTQRSGALTLKHYGCMVDLFARAGHLDKAEEFIRWMPIEPDDIIWKSLIWAARQHGDGARAQRLVEEHLLKMQSVDSGSCILAGNVYASNSNWGGKAQFRMLMDEKTGGKPPGWSRIEVGRVVHEFMAGDCRHKEALGIYEKLKEIAEVLQREGYTPKTSQVLLDMEEEEEAATAKGMQLMHHSEKLAVAFGLMTTGPGEKIIVTKNLRSCDDCHEVMKLISRAYNREIVIRDRIRFHHFMNGSCSCGDFW